MPLDKTIDQLRAVTKLTRHPDGDGLVLSQFPNGTMTWHFKYWLDGKEKMATLGHFRRAGNPNVQMSLKAARKARDVARGQVALGNSPTQEQAKAKKETARVTVARADDGKTFKACADDWLGTRTWSRKVADQKARDVTRFFYPDFRDRAIADITSDELRTLVKRRRLSALVQERMRKMFQLIADHAISLGWCKSGNVAVPLKAAMPKHVGGNYAHLTSEEMTPFVQKLYEYDDSPRPSPHFAFDYNATNANRWFAKRMTILCMLTFVRSTEIRFTRWSEIDFKHEWWTIPAHRMKRTRATAGDHHIPLSRQALEILKELRARAVKDGTADDNDFVFQGQKKLKKCARYPMGNRAMLDVIDAIGYKYKMTGHGFRHVADTLLNEVRPLDKALVEAQMAHVKKGMDGKYDHSKYLEYRPDLLQRWADMVDQMRNGKVFCKVIDIKVARLKARLAA